MRLTQNGEAILAGNGNAVEWNGIDDWVAGAIWIPGPRRLVSQRADAGSWRPMTAWGLSEETRADRHLPGFLAVGLLIIASAVSRDGERRRRIHTENMARAEMFQARAGRGSCEGDGGPSGSRCNGRWVAERQGWAICEEYTDHAVSGATLLRAGFQALMRDALNHRFDVVLAESLDRFSLDQEDTAGVFKRLTFAGVNIVTLEHTSRAQQAHSHDAAGPAANGRPHRRRSRSRRSAPSPRSRRRL